MTPEIQTNKKKDRLTFIGLLFAIYYAVLACYNTPVTLRLGYILISGLIIVKKLFSSDRLKIEFPTACKYLYYFTIFCYFSRFWAWEEYLVVNYSDFLIPVMLFMVIAINYFIKIRSTKACLYAIILSGLALSIYVIIDNGGLSAFYNSATQAGNRLTASDRNENHVGMIGAFAVVVLFYYAMFKGKKLCYLISLLPFVVSVASGSRMAIITLVVGLFSLVILSQKDKKGIVKYLKLIALLLILCVGIYFVLSLEIMSTVRIRMENMLEDFFGHSVAITNNASARIRARMIAIGLQQFKETPFIGIGFGNSPVLNWQKVRHFYYCHNDYIEHLVNGGVVSFILYYGTIFYLAIRHIKLMKINKKPELVISFVIMIMFLVKNVGGVSYYGSINTYLYFTLWISEVAICEREEYEKTLQESNE